MPTFDLRYIQAAKYAYDTQKKTVSYSGKTKVGDAMSVDLQLKFAEGRLYAEGKLAEYIREAIGGTMSMAVKHILDEAQKLLYGATESSRTVNTKAVKGLKISANGLGSYVGISFYAPDKIDGVTKYTCVHVVKSLFGYPGMSYKTKGGSLEFKTPTTTGEFLPSDAEDEALLEVAVVDDTTTAQAWCDAVLAGTA